MKYVYMLYANDGTKVLLSIHGSKKSALRKLLLDFKGEYQKDTVGKEIGRKVGANYTYTVEKHIVI